MEDLVFADSWLQWSALSGAMFLLIAWSLVWKGMALWRAARRSSKIWFVVFLIVNTVGVLEILYLYVFSRRSKSAQLAGSGQVLHHDGTGQGSAA